MIRDDKIELDVIIVGKGPYKLSIGGNRDLLVPYIMRAMNVPKGEAEGLLQLLKEYGELQLRIREDVDGYPSWSACGP